MQSPIFRLYMASLFSCMHACVHASVCSLLVCLTRYLCVSTQHAVLKMTVGQIYVVHALSLRESLTICNNATISNKIANQLQKLILALTRSPTYITIYSYMLQLLIITSQLQLCDSCMPYQLISIPIYSLLYLYIAIQLILQSPSCAYSYIASQIFCMSSIVRDYIETRHTRESQNSKMAQHTKKTS